MGFPRLAHVSSSRETRIEILEASKSGWLEEFLGDNRETEEDLRAERGKREKTMDLCSGSGIRDTDGGWAYPGAIHLGDKRYCSTSGDESGD